MNLELKQRNAEGRCRLTNSLTFGKTGQCQKDLNLTISAAIENASIQTTLSQEHANKINSTATRLLQPSMRRKQSVHKDIFTTRKTQPST